MRLVDVLARLLNMGPPVFQTSDAAAYLGVGNAHASQLLARFPFTMSTPRSSSGINSREKAPEKSPRRKKL